MVSSTGFMRLVCLLASLHGRNMLDHFVRYYLRSPGKNLRTITRKDQSIFNLHGIIFVPQDKVDDVLLDIKSTALKFGDKTNLYLSGFGTSMIASLIASGIMAGQTWPYYTAVGLVGGHLATQVIKFH